MVFMSVQDAVDLIRLEYAETPALQLTFCQVRRLWNLSDELCERALRVLVRSGFLVCTPDGCYGRPSGDQPVAVFTRREV